ncbi:MAG: acylphosphatase [Blastochloris sp.]|jgi:acylphosphatase|nr:acylphosphatase [Blastochloris sp.]
MKARRIFYEGKVQGVGFRYSIKQIVSGYDICGSVGNLNDGRVELLIQGEEADLKDLLQTILSSHLKGFIKQIESYEVDVDQKLRGFSILSKV